MRKVLIASAVALVLFAVGAFAATFAVNSDDIASGSDDVVACATRVDVDWTVGTYDAAANDWNVTHAVLEFYNGTTLTANCGGFEASVQVEGTGNTIVGSGGPTAIGATATSVTVPLSAGVTAGEIVQASVLVDGKELTLSSPAATP